MKKLTLLAAPLAFVLPTAAFSADMGNLKHSGFVDIVFTLSDGTDEYDANNNNDSDIDKKFGASGELDLETELNPHTKLRFDLDLSSGVDSAVFEQARLDYAINENMDLTAGIFNNNLGFEKEDAPDMYQTSHSQLWDIWNEQTALNGNNLAGVEFSAKVAIVTLTAGLVNDLNHTDEEISFKFAADIQAMESMNITAGLITADEGTATTTGDTNAGTIIDAAITWKWNNLMVGGEVMSADEIYDLAMQVTANYAFTDFMSGTARFDYVDYELNYDKSTSLTIGALFTVAKNLYANAEIRSMQNDDDATSATANPNRKVGDGTVVQLELVGTF